MLTISHSSTTMFNTCPRKYFNQYHLGRVPARDDAKLVFGRLMHECTALWWSDGVDAVRAYLIEHAANIDPTDAAKISALLEHYAPPREAYEVVGVEVPFTVTVPHPKTGRALRGVRFRGFVDAVLRERSTGRTIIRECKTTTEEIIGFGPFWARVAIDAQTALYKWAFGADGAVYDVIRKPLLRPSSVDRKAARERIETHRGNTDIEPTELDVLEQYQRRVSCVIAELPEQWFQWRPLWKGEEDVREAHLDLYHTVRSLQRAEREGAFPRHVGACRGIYGVCPFLDCCAGRASIDDEGLFVDRVAV